MRCSDFIDNYSDYRDRLIPDAFTRKRFERHVRRCARCRRYDRAVRAGVTELRRSGLVPSRRFAPILRWRLATASGAGGRRRAWPAGVAAALLVTAVVWEGLARTSEQIETPSPLPGRPVAGMPTAVEHPFATFTNLDVAVFEVELPPADTPASPHPLDYPAPYRLVSVQADAPR